MPDYRERLRRLAWSDPVLIGEEVGSYPEHALLDGRMLAVARLASLVAIHGSGPSFAQQTDAAIAAGLSTDEIVDVLFAISSVVGSACVVSAAPTVALALGFDVEDDVD